ncbi:MAG: FAD-binding oxidoreductase [Candidatus Thorarchaeota archaeon]|nr:FAD-binding oxidoreductase [Candidatus Thorarchaeota archaeon]
MRIRDVVIGANASMYYKLNFRKIKGVYYPRNTQEVIGAVKHAQSDGFTVTPKGGGSGLSGACTGGNDERVMISSLQMKEILTVSKDQGYVDVQPGISIDKINEFLNPMGMRFYVAPSSRDIATAAGVLSTDGGGNDTWVNGTMRDNTIRVKMVLYDGRLLTIDAKGVKSNDPDLEARLNEIGVTLHDVASSHGTLGFITEMRLLIRPVVEETLIGGLAEFSECNALGKVLTDMIERTSPVRYGEAITTAHKDVREGFDPPLLILEFPEENEVDIRDITDYKPLDSKELARMKDIRIKLPKRNPNEGVQFALFEGYGFHGDSLLNLQDSLNEVEALLNDHGMKPFGKYGHGPSKWYLGDNTPTYGLILHSREIRPEGKTGEELLDTVLAIVDKCEELGVTPKPEHKWPFSDAVKKKRLDDIRQVIGEGFNPFLLSPECNDVLGSMV